MKLTPEIIQEISAYINEGIVKKRNKELKNDRESGGNTD
jgi:hypothetical protein